jgi:tetratricopeptide (TPR) repeat protein
LRPALAAFEALLEITVEDTAWARLDTAVRQQRTVEAVKALLLRESRVQPLLLVLEDLHWMDDATQALLDSLVESLPAARVLLLVNYRPEYRHAWGNKTYYTQLRLDPLPPETAEGMLDTLMGGNAGLTPLKRILIDRTQGNPFFLEETVRSLVESGALTGPAGEYSLTGPLSTIQIPATVQAVLAARIDRLPAEDKRVLQLASVIGRTVSLPLLRAIADVAETDLQSCLARLQAAEFLYEARLFPEPEYAFRHALTLDVAYAGLLQESRRRLHARIVEALERLYPERLSEHAARLAHHSFRGEVWGKALTYLTQQSETAASRSSLDAVLGTGAGVSSDESPAALWWSGEYARTIEVAERDLTVAANFRDFGMSVIAMCRLGQAHHTLGDYGRAADFLRRPLAQLQGDLEQKHFGMAAIPAVFARAWLTWCLAEVGSFEEGVTHAEEAVVIAEKADHPYSQGIAAWGLGMLHLVRGDPERAIAVLERGLVVTRMADIALLFPFMSAPLGAAYALAGRVSNGVALPEAAIRQAMSMDLQGNHALRLTWLGEALLLGGQIERAREQATQAVAIAERRGERGSHAYARRLHGEIARLREPPDPHAAISEHREALRSATALGMRPLVARCRLDLATALQAIGAREEAQAEREAAAEAFRELKMPGWLGRMDTRGALSR